MVEVCTLQALYGIERGEEIDVVESMNGFVQTIAN
jgi:hypothetical protein